MIRNRPRGLPLCGLLGVLALGGCDINPPPLNFTDGYLHLSYAGSFECGGQPVSVDANHGAVILKGGCKKVVVHGSDNTVTVYADPGASLDATGSRNLIVWQLTSPGEAPTMTTEGDANRYAAGPLPPGR